MLEMVRVVMRERPPVAPVTETVRERGVIVVGARPGPEFEAALDLRRRVFVAEQGMTDGGLTDRDEARSLTALACLPMGGRAEPVGTGRLTLGFGEQGEALIAWVATAPEARGRGVGRAVMRFLLEAAADGKAPRVVLAAQSHAEEFYRRLGFVPAGDPYTVRGVRHRWMVYAGL
jgi:predicted GNAT family N-acyltransferase